MRRGRLLGLHLHRQPLRGAKRKLYRFDPSVAGGHPGADLTSRTSARLSLSLSLRVNQIASQRLAVRVDDIGPRSLLTLAAFRPNCCLLLGTRGRTSFWSPAMFKQVFSACLFVVLSSICSEARPYRIGHAPECNVIMPCDFSSAQTRGERISQYSLQAYRPKQLVVTAANSLAMSVPAESRIAGGRPPGCPAAFCGCGAALRVFGRVAPELNLAANWLRFPRTSPSPGMVAARRGHVFVLEQHLRGDIWMAYDANSGGHATRMHARSLRGYTVVNPHVAA